MGWGNGGLENLDMALGGQSENESLELSGTPHSLSQSSGGSLATSRAQHAHTHLQVSSAVHDAADVVGAVRALDAHLGRANNAPQCTLRVTYVHNTS